MKDYLYSPVAEVPQTVHIDAVFDEYPHTTHMSAVGVLTSRAVHNFLCVLDEDGSYTLNIRVSEWHGFVGPEEPMSFDDEAISLMSPHYLPWHMRQEIFESNERAIMLSRHNNGVCTPSECDFGDYV